MAEAKFERRALLVCKKNANSALYHRSLKSVEFEVDVTDSLADVEALLKKNKTKILVHSLEGFERNETTKFHHNMCRSELGSQIQRFMIYRANNMRAVAFSLDVGMQKALPQERAALTLGNAVQLVVQAMQNRDSLQEAGLALATSGKVVLSEDEMVQIEKVYRAFPNDMIIRSAQARVYVLRGEYPMAVELARRILQAEPYAVRAMTILGEVEAKLGQYELALKLIGKANELAGGNPDRLATLARLCIEQGQYPEAKKFLMEGMRLFPQLQVLRDELQKVPLNGAEVREALSMGMPHMHGDALTQYACALVKPLVLLRQFQFVADAINATVEILPETNQKCGYLFKVADELRAMGAKNEAVAQLRRCLEIDPKYPGAGDLLIKIKTNLAA
ncbi:MAG: Tetratricopeptide repeat [Pseudomonadota bacterium]|jgi:tetratricopeptide (TPR) repeat protein